MFDAPFDAWYVWIGLAVVGVVALAVAVRLPGAAAPDATATAERIDQVAASQYAATATHPVDAEQIELGAYRLRLRGPGGTAQAALAYGPVTPVPDGGPLRAVLDGTAPSRVFDDRSEFSAAAAAAQQREPTWQPVDGTVRIRRVIWEGVDVTLVGA
ncbi:hypothetical protein BRC83_01555 [Halobacteriales archaeon QS_1_68_17]|nr:MAG: hypothetical protein BRC83_01555 [Halobacteriales archaeon QS_1_68_17]